MKTSFVIFLTLILFYSIFAQRTCSQSDNEHLSIVSPVNSGEAYVWYLYHSGWAVKTKNSFLIFDYTEESREPEIKNLKNGFINPAEIADQRVVVFTSHKHSDHYDPITHSWIDKINDITYFWGWENSFNQKSISFDSTRVKITIEDIVVYNIHHKFDGISESAFLVNVDGLWIYHAGDHGQPNAKKSNLIFKDNIEYLSSLSEQLDIMFIPVWGSELYSIKQLSPNLVFPMHYGGNENQYEKYAQKIKHQNLKVAVGVARHCGDRFYYSNLDEN